MANLAFVLCVFVFPAASLCLNEGAAPVLNSNNDSIIYGEIGQNVILTCETANENDTLAWYFNNVPLSTESQVRGTYTLSPLQVGNGGWYTCAAANRFGRDEKDFLLVAGAPPVEMLTFTNDVYRVPVGYDAELPCRFMGTPHPTIRWFDANSGNEISTTASRYEIISSTGSLVVSDSGQPEILVFYCTANNTIFNTAVSNNVTVEFFNLNQPISFPLLLLSNYSLPSNLTCTNLTNPVDSNYTIQWTKDLDPASLGAENTLAVTESGYYCCNVSRAELSSYFCTTVLADTSSNPMLFGLESANVSLPSNRNRTVGLLCNGSTPSGYDPPLMKWLNSRNNLLTSANDLVVSNSTSGLGYLSSNRTLSQYTCQGSNSAGNVSTSVYVSYIVTCSGTDELKGGNAELSTAELNNYWTSSGDGASIDFVNNENVFKLEYTGTSSPSFTQMLTMPNTLSRIEISGRMRQNGSGVASIQILIDGEVFKVLNNPYPTLTSWQWFSATLQQMSVSNLTIVMMVRGSSESGVVYFDDLCVTISPNEGLDLIKIITIGVGAGCGVLLILIIITVCCICCCCCCCGKKKGDVKMMKKMTTLIKKKHSAVIKELKVTEGRYTTEPVAQKKSTETEMYAVADPDPEAHVESSYNSAYYTSYINPENYASSPDGQHSARIPSVVVERPHKSSNAGQENSVYTSLKHGALDKENVYQAPASHPSSTSLKNLVSDDEQYVEVEGGSAAANYMKLLASDEEKSGRTFSSGSRPRSPCPEFPPPLPPSEKQQIYENSTEVTVPFASTNEVFRRTSTDGGAIHLRSGSQLASPTLVQSGDHQIYENSQEVVPSSVPLFNGSFQHGSAMDGMRSASPCSPRMVSSQLLDDEEQQIYENSEEVMMGEEEDMEDDIYENDVPGMNLSPPNSNPITGKHYTNVNS